MFSYPHVDLPDEQPRCFPKMFDYKYLQVDISCKLRKVVFIEFLGSSQAVGPPIFQVQCCLQWRPGGCTGRWPWSISKAVCLMCAKLRATGILLAFFMFFHIFVQIIIEISQNSPRKQDRLLFYRNDFWTTVGLCTPKHVKVLRIAVCYGQSRRPILWVTWQDIWSKGIPFNDNLGSVENLQ